MGQIMSISKEQLDLVTEYVQNRLKIVEYKSESDHKFEIAHQELKHQKILMIKGFKDTERRFEHMEKRFEQVEKRFEQVDKRFEQVDKRFEQVDKRFEQVDKRFEQINQRFDFQITSARWQTGLILTFILGLYVKLFNFV